MLNILYNNIINNRSHRSLPEPSSATETNRWPSGTPGALGEAVAAIAGYSYSYSYSYNSWL